MDHGVSLYVDDLIYTGNSEKMMQDFKNGMMETYEMSDLGILHYFLGMEIYHSNDGIFISQKKYAKNILKKFKMHDCKSVITPLYLMKNKRCVMELARMIQQFIEVWLGAYYI